MERDEVLVPAEEMVGRPGVRFPNESAAYREARRRLLIEEIELRRHLERVAAMRRALPPGGEVTKRYRFAGEGGEVTLEGMFGDKETLIVYSYMFGPQREAPCPVCTSFMASWEMKIEDLRQRVSIAFMARSPLERLVEAKRERGWVRMPVFSDGDGEYTRDYVSAEDGDAPGLTVFTRRDGVVRHFWSAEMNDAMRDPGQDPRDAPDLDPLWLLLDKTPEGRGVDWYPRLSYAGGGGCCG